MKIKNFFYLIFIYLMFLVSCSKKEENIITFWHFWSEPNQTKVLKTIIEDFEKQNNCKVELTELSWGDGKTKLFAAFNSNTAPDVLELGSDWVAQFSSVGVLKELDSSEFNISKFIGYSLEPSYWGGKLYAIPWVIDTRVLFYNKGLMKLAGLEGNPPKNMKELLEFSQKINELDNAYGIGINGSDPHRLYKKVLYFIWTLGGNIVDSNGVICLNDPKVISAVEFYANLSNYGYIETQRELDVAFVKGKIGFWISGGWLVTKIQNENPKLDYGVAVLPGRDQENPGISFAGGEYLAINAKSQRVELAKKLIAYLTSGENSIKFCKQVVEAGFPADKNFFNDTFYLNQPERMIFMEQLKSSRMTPVLPQWLDIEALLENAVVEVLYGKKTAYDALNDAQRKALNILVKK